MWWCGEKLGSGQAPRGRLFAAYRQRNLFMDFAGVMYGLDPLRGMRRFRHLLMHLGLPANQRTRGSGASSASKGGR